MQTTTGLMLYDTLERKDALTVGDNGEELVFVAKNGERRANVFISYSDGIRLSQWIIRAARVRTSSLASASSLHDTNAEAQSDG